MATAAADGDHDSGGSGEARGPALWRAGFVVTMGICATTLAQDKVLGRIPVRNLLKNDLHLSRTDTATFLFLIGLAWYAKPLIGAVIDAFPLFGTRRRSYMVLGSALAASGWIATGMVAHSYAPLLYLMTFTCTAMVVASTATGGFLVETAQAYNVAGRMASLRMAVDSMCFLVSAPLSGYLAGIAFGWTAASCAGIALLLIPVALFSLREKHHPAQPLSALGGQLKAIAGARTLWAASGLMVLFYLAPGLDTAAFYKQQNDLHMTTEMQGWLQFVSFLGVLAMAGAYYLLSRHFTLRTLLASGIFVAAVTAVTMLVYNSVIEVFVVTTLSQIGFYFAELAFLDLCSRAAPVGSESFGYALLMSVRNLVLFGADILGSKLLDDWHWTWDSLVWINAGTTIVALPFVFLLPRAVLAVRDA